MSESIKSARGYDGTLARIAGNILSGRDRSIGQRTLTLEDKHAVRWAVAMASAIVAEVKSLTDVRMCPGRSDFADLVDGKIDD